MTTESSVFCTSDVRIGWILLGWVENECNITYMDLFFCKNTQ